MPATPAHRNNQLAQIHIARAQLGMSEDEYRDLMSVKFNGIRSAAALSAQQRQELLHHFQLCGWQGSVPGSRANGAATKKVPWSPAVKKLFSVWQQLADARLVNDRSGKALSAWCARQTAGADGQGGVQRVEWLNPAQLHAVTENAKLWLKRAQQGEAAAAPEPAPVGAADLMQAIAQRAAP